MSPEQDPVEPAEERWHIVTPFKVKGFGRFRSDAEEASFYRLFALNQAGFAYCAKPHHDDSRPSLESLYELLQKHLVPREYAIIRIEHPGEEVFEHGESVGYKEGHVRYEKVYSDRIEPTVYSDDIYGR